MNLSMYENLLTHLIRRFPRENRNCLNLLAFLVEANIRDSDDDRSNMLFEAFMSRTNLETYLDLISNPMQCIEKDMDNHLFKGSQYNVDVFLKAFHDRFKVDLSEKSDIVVELKNSISEQPITMLSNVVATNEEPVKVIEPVTVTEPIKIVEPIKTEPVKAEKVEEVKKFTYTKKNKHKQR